MKKIDKILIIVVLIFFLQLFVRMIFNGNKIEVDSDAYYIEQVNKENPTWEYDKCKDYLFLSDKDFEDKYGVKSAEIECNLK